MLTVIQISLLVATSVVMVKGLHLNALTPMERAFQDVLNTNNLFRRHVRDTRTESEGVPCVTVPFLTELKERFVRWLDKNNDGLSTFDEVKNYLRKFKPNIKDDAVEAFIRRRDTNGNEAIDFVPEYVHDLSVPDYTIEGAKEWFNLQDTDDNGLVDEKELLDVAQAIGMSPEEAVGTVQHYYMPADVDKDGKLTFDEFKTLYNQ